MVMKKSGPKAHSHIPTLTYDARISYFFWDCKAFPGYFAPQSKKNPPKFSPRRIFPAKPPIRPASQRLPCGKGDVCERRQWRKKRAKRSGSGQNSVSVCEQRILGTATGAVARRARRPGVPSHGCPERGMVAGYPLRGFHPHFLFAAAKRKRRWSRQKKKRLSLRSYGRGAPCRAAGRGPKRSCSMDAAPTRTRAGLLAGYRTWYAVLNKEVIGQNLNLTSSSFRAFRFAKRCPGGRGAVPLLGWSLRRFPPIPRGRWRGRFVARRLAWVVDWAFRRARRLGVPFPSSFVGRPEPPSIVKRTDSHVGPLGLLGMTKDQDCHCEEQSDVAIRNSRPPRLPCAKGAVSRRLTEGLSGVDGPFGDDLCRNSHPSLATAPQTLRSAPLARVVDATFSPFRRGRCPHRPFARHHR